MANINALCYAVKDNAVGQLNAGIGASTISIVLGSGEGATFPQPIKNTATSAGTSTTLNSTGIGASGVVVGDHIWNATDDSWAVIKTVTTNQITTTPLQGGSGNDFGSADETYVDAFIVTLNKKDASEKITAQEKVRIRERSSDTLTCVVGDRGFDGTSGLAFLAADYCELFVEQLSHEEMRKAIAANAIRLDDEVSTLATEIILTAGGALTSTTDGAPISQIEYTTNDVDVAVAIIGASEDKSNQWSFQMPSNYDGGQFRAEFTWIGASTNTGNCRFGIKAKCVGNNELIDSAWGTEVFVTDANTGNGKKNTTSTVDFTASGTPAAGEEVFFKSQRTGTNASDTYTGDCYLKDVRIFYNI